MNLGNRFSQKSFAQIPQANVARSAFDRSFTKKDTFYFDDLTPVFVDEILPGDTVNLNVKTFMRLAPQIKPVMDNMMVDFFFFFVPNRLTWENWERFNGAQDNPDDSVDFLIPTITAPPTGFTVGSIYDHMGLPTGVGNIEINALPFRAINLIRNEWFRDQNLQDSFTVPKGDGPDSPGLYNMFTRAKVHDYFTSCLPWPQKGDPVELPLGTTAPVTVNKYNTTTGGGPITNADIKAVSDSVAPYTLRNFSAGDFGAPTTNVNANNATLLGTADLSASTAVTINALREAIMYQSFLELDARGGTRYVEILKSHFNVVSPDFRLQRPEFLSGGQIRIAQHPVAQTSQTTGDDAPLGDLAAYSTASEMGNKIGFSKSFVEHGYVIGFMQARGELTYQQGIEKFWSRQTREDFFWPKFQELGEQAVLNKEIYAQGNSTDNETFGYQERYAEYRYKPSQICGQFRSTFAQSLDVWHLAQDFSSLPALNADFIQSNTPIERVLIVPEAGYPHLLGDFWFQYNHVRPMVARPVPATLGRF